MTNNYPRFRTHVRKGANGQVWVSYYYDNRGTGKKDVPLGKDYAQAMEKWNNIRNHQPLVRGLIQEAIDRYKEKVLPGMIKGTRQQYTTYLKQVEPYFGPVAWHQVTLPILLDYLESRTKKTSANRELSVLGSIWNLAVKWGLTEKTWPAAGLGKWKNTEKKRNIFISEEQFNAIYKHADRLLRDSMDIASATGLRVTDVRTILMPKNGVLTFSASKTTKSAEFIVADSPVLSRIVARREAMKAHCVMLLCTDTGRQATERMLLNRWNTAKGKATAERPELGLDGLYNRDMRKVAANLSATVEDAQKLLQHSSAKVTADHYFNRPTKLKAVR
jgi:integrase